MRDCPKVEMLPMRAVIKSLLFALLIAGLWFLGGHLAYAKLPQMLWETGTWLVFGVGLLGACFLLLRGDTRVETLFLALFYVFFVLLSLVIFLSLVSDSGSVYLRYLLAPLWITPLPVAWAISVLVQPG